MSKARARHQCQECGHVASRWSGQCPECGAWNSLVEQIGGGGRAASARGGYAGGVTAGGVTGSVVVAAENVDLAAEPAQATGLAELDRVLGGGLVPGAVVLLGGDPGIGKSTLLLQALAQVIARGGSGLYVTGEESLGQVVSRADRLGLARGGLRLLAETQVEAIVAHAAREQPKAQAEVVAKAKVLVIDSVQTMHTELLGSAPGGVAQVRESAAQLVRFAKATGTSLLLVGHVTKEGALAGPRVLEHMVDTVLYFESENSSRFRLIRAVKNRFGAANEMGIFAMTERGLRGVGNPSAIFLSRSGVNSPGSVVTVTREGTRPLMLEVQALVDQSNLGNPRRLAVGTDQNRLAMLLAVLHRHGGITAHDQDVFVNVVGGVRVSETAADLAIVVAAVSSLRDRALTSATVVFGELGLAGEVRPVPSGEERLREAVKHGFDTAIAPRANVPKRPIAGLRIVPVDTLAEALEQL
ncbi:MAG: DNA repair protein RadA [Gammaproteobacteria bacterium]|nr:DNA repair protein RadA [Gammaproteobacteria bacterium]